MKIIILCAGEATRWNNYLGFRKHLVPVFGESLLQRTVRLILSIDASADITIVVKAGDEELYRVEGAKTVAANLNLARFDADKFMSSKAYWSAKDDTVLLYGDAFFTKDALDTIITTPADDWLLFARFGPSNYSGTEWGECFAFRIAPSFHEEFWNVGNYLIRQYRAGLLNRIGGWEFYSVLTSTDINNPGVQHSNGIEIHDWTEDFDYPEDFSKWCERVVMNGVQV